jgi:hypothetical protein
MKVQQSFRSKLRYGQHLVKSGMSGLSSGRQAHLNGQPLSGVLSQAARASLGLAVFGTCAGLLRYSFPARRDRVSKAITCGIAGGAMGFVAGLAWKTRELTGSMTRSAAKQMGTVRDEHWLDRHPIDYA